MAVDQEKKTRYSDTLPDPFLGRSFDGYKVDEIIGRGGMGVVYKATQLSLGRPVAIKILPEEFAEHPQFLERFHREVDILSKLSHPNIVTVFERGEVDGRQYLVMEYIAGTSLREVMKQGPLPKSEALSIVRSVLSALEHAHAGGVVHRDIKPENVLTAPGGIVKVADFGLSRVLGPQDMTRLTHTHLLLGTFEYMAPEQREKAKEADERSDLYATGVVLYEMLAGELPIGHFKLLSKKRPTECDARIDDIVRKSLEKSPDERYQRAAEMGGDVSRLLTNVPLEPVPHADEAAATPVPVAQAPAPPAPAATDERTVRNYLTIAILVAAMVYAFNTRMRDEDWMVWGLCVAGAVLLVQKAKSGWVKRLFQEWPVARITGKPPKDLAMRVIEDRNVQMHLRQAVPGLWANFPKGVEFDTDEGRLMLELSPHLNVLEDVPARLASAIGRVLEKSAPEYYKAIAVADDEWEERTSALVVPASREIAAAAPSKQKSHRGPGGLDTAWMSFPAGIWMMTVLALTGFAHDARTWLLFSAGCAMILVSTHLLRIGRWLTFILVLALVSGGAYMGYHVMHGLAW